MVDSLAEIVFLILLFIVVFVAFTLLFSFLLMSAWNYVIPAIFGLPQINIWQAFALVVIASIIFGGTRVRSS